jgi:NAD(P)H-hydrate epimerase
MTVFQTESGLEIPSVTADQMREIDRIAIEETGPNLFQMMENAGRSLATVAMTMVGNEWHDTPIVVLAGRGGNGGGGICAARHLANRGANVSLAITDASRLDGVPKAQLDIYRRTAGRLIDFENMERDVGLIIDAVIGYSLSGPPRGDAGAMIEHINQAPAPVLSLDVPSGVDATTGESPSVAVNADLTLTLALPKTGLGSRAVGDLWLADLGIPEETYRRSGLDVPEASFGAEFVQHLWLY